MACASLSPWAGAQSALRAADFGAVANDGKCDKAAIKKAIAAAAQNGAKEIVFEKGVYDLNVGDAENNIAIEIANIDGLTFAGALDENGNPATFFVRRYDFKNSLNAREILFVSGCKNFTLKNAVFDNYPRYMTAGEIVANDGESITVKVLEGNPFIADTVIYCANIWDKNTHNLIKAPSVTYGGILSGDVESRKEEYTMRVLGDPSQRLMKLNSKDVAKKVQKGQIFSWHFGWLGYQVNFVRCEDLRLENVHTYSAIGVAVNSMLCKNTYAKGVKFLRQDNQMQVGCRDAWIVQLCNGRFSVEDMYVEGVRWDGQNVCGRFAFLKEKTDLKSAVFSNYFFGAKAFLFPKGSKVGFCRGRDDEVMLTVVSASDLPVKPYEKPAVKVRFAEDLPDFAAAGAICNLYGGYMDSYELRNCTFKNIAGSASLIRGDNAKISNCVFEYVMYPAVVLGGDLASCEGGIGKNFSVENCTFKDSAWQERHGAQGALSIKPEVPKRFDGQEIPFIKNVSIKNNFFENCEVGIEFGGVKGIQLSGNKFKNVKKPVYEYDSYGVSIKN